MNTDTIPIEQDERRGCTSASNAQADTLCPGRHQAQKGKPETNTEDAKFGQEIHDALATGDVSKLNPEQLKIKEMCDEIVASLVTQFFPAEEVNSLKRFVEQRYWCLVKKQWEHSGRVDLVLRSPTRALVIEYKTLPGDQAGAAENMQLRDECTLVGRSLLCNVVGGAIVQPLVTMSPQIVEYYADHIDQAEREMWDRVEKSNSPDAPRVAGPVQCKFCRARFDCQEYRDMCAVSVPSKPIADLATVRVADWTPEQRAQFCAAMPVALKFIEESKNQLKALLESDPQSVPGFTLEEGALRRPIRDAEALHQRFVAIGGKTEDFLKCVDVGKGNFESLVRAATGLKGKALNAKIDELLSGLTDDKRDKPSIAKAK